MPSKLPLFLGRVVPESSKAVKRLEIGELPVSQRFCDETVGLITLRMVNQDQAEAAS